ncbi:hypothetical protein T439DRAFT_380377 [Meredithblackwellia eburnea MCA 4105]
MLSKLQLSTLLLTVLQLGAVSARPTQNGITNQLLKRQVSDIPEACGNACNVVTSEFSSCNAANGGSAGSNTDQTYLSCICAPSLLSDYSSCYSCIQQEAPSYFTNHPNDVDLRQYCSAYYTPGVISSSVVVTSSSSSSSLRPSSQISSVPTSSSSSRISGVSSTTPVSGRSSSSTVSVSSSGSRVSGSVGAVTASATAHSGARRLAAAAGGGNVFGGPVWAVAGLVAAGILGGLVVV